MNNVEQINTIENQDSNLDNLQTDIVDNQLTNLEDKVENINNNSQFLEIIKETWLYTKLQESFKDNTIYPDLNWNIEAKINRFSESINNTVVNYLSWILSTPENPFSNEAIKSMSTSIQFLLMETLNEQSNTKNWKFFESFWKINLEWINSILWWLTWAFGKSTWFLNLWKKITRTIDILSFNTSKLKTPEKIPTIMNPYKFMNIIKNINLDTTKDITLVSLKDIWIIDLEWDITMTETEKNYLKQIAENSKLKNDPETIKWIIKSLDSASKLIDKRSDLSQKAMDLMDKADWLLWPFQNMLWINIMDILKPFKWVLNIFLSFLWFSWGLDWLERKWLRKKIDKEFDISDRTEFISQILSDFTDNSKDKTISNWILTKYSSIISQIPDEKKLLIDFDYDILYKSIIKDRTNKDWKTINFSENINPMVLKNMWWEYTTYIKESKNSDWEIQYSIDPSFDWQKEQFTENYIKYILPEITKNSDFIEKIKTPDELAFSIIWSMFVDSKYMIDWIKTQAISPQLFLQETEINQENQNNSNEQVETTVDEDKLINAIKESIIPHESAWNYWAVNKDDVWTWVSISLIQRHWERARKICKNLYEKDKILFQNIMWDKIVDDIYKTNQRASSENSDKNKVVWTDLDVSNFKKLMENQKFKDIIDNQIRSDCLLYIQAAKEQWITDPKAIIYYSNIMNKYWISWAKKYVWDGSLDSMYAKVWKRDYIKTNPYPELYNQENIA